MTNQELAGKIVELVGGEGNISDLTHCATRLRFNLKDNDKAKLSALSNLEGVLTAQIKNGQTQVVIGAKVNAIFNEVLSMVHLSNDGAEMKEKPKNKISAVIETIAGVFSPTLPVLVGCGMFKAIVSLLTNCGIASADASYMLVFSMIGDLIFYFFPFFLAVSCARKFKVSEYMAIALAAAYMYPTIMNGAASAAETGVTTLSFFGLPILYVNYKSTVIPIILSVWVLSLIYKKIDSLVPDFLKILLTSMLVLFVMVPLELIVLGPIGSYAGTYIAKFMDWFYQVGGFVAAALLGGTRSLLTMMGMHYALAPLQIQQIAETGMSTLLVSALTANFAQAGAALGAAIVIKDKSEKSVAASASLSAFLGITEPAMYAVNLKYKKPFFFAMASSAVAAAFLSLFHAGAIAYAPPGLFTIVTYQADSFLFIILGVLLAAGMACILTAMFGIPKKVQKAENISGEHGKQKIDDEQKTDDAVEKSADSLEEVMTVSAPLIGKAVPLAETPDEAFAQGIMGQGIAIIPSEGKVVAPFDGAVVALFPTNHAIGLVSENGIELLIHVGMDTVNLNGQFFTAHVKSGDKVKKGDLLIEFQLKEIAEKYPVITPVLVSNTAVYSQVEGICQEHTNLSSPVIQIKK